MDDKVWYSSEAISEDYIHINNCSKLNHSLQSSRNIRPRGRKDYLLIYVMSGRCYLDIDSDNTQIAEKGSIIIYEPDKPQDYSFLSIDKSVQIYIHFTGTGCRTILEKANITGNQIITPSRSNELENFLVKICEEFDNTDIRKKLICEGLLMAVLGIISTKNSQPDTQTKYSKVLNDIIGNIRTSANQPYNVEKWASQCHLTKSHFIQVFKKSTGLPPYQYLTKMRIKHAKELLLFTDMPIFQIGELCGYSDYNYFTRIFKKNEGVSPTKYRNNKKI